MVRPRWIIGIDPGVTGAWAMYDEKHNTMMAYSFMLFEETKPNRRRAPDRKVKKRSPTRVEREYDLDWFALRMIEFSSHDEGCSVHVEHVTSMPRDGSTQAFKFGKCFGEIRGVLAGCRIRSSYHRPADWMRAMGVDGDKKKRAMELQRLADEGDIVLLPDDLTDGMVDACLIAIRGVRLERA